MNNNLPPGCRIKDIPGNGEIDIYIDDYVDRMWNDHGAFTEWLAGNEDVNGDIDLSLMRRLLEFSDVNECWHQHLCVMGEKSYWSSRDRGE